MAEKPLARRAPPPLPPRQVSRPAVYTPPTPPSEQADGPIIMLDADRNDSDSLRTSLLSTSSQASPDSDTTVSPWQDNPPPYSSVATSAPWTSQDPRSSSTHSLQPMESQASTEKSGKRRLLLIYIHGFMGNETSFQSFPAHVHNLLVVLLANSHVVHTKIYPRYRSKKAIQVATNDFSTWLKPLESPNTDIILLGHSLGGILAAEVALLPSTSSANPQSLRHRLLGTIGFDTPYLGMHHGVIKAGLGSIFRPSPSPTGSSQQSSTDANTAQPTSPPSGLAGMLSAYQSLDPNYNPPLPNDVRLATRSGWSNALHFINKHSKDLRHATKQLVTSHLEFGGCLADYDGLKRRYMKIRMLEEEDQQARKTVVESSTPPARVRFVNYYTASTGRLKTPKEPARVTSGFEVEESNRILDQPVEDSQNTASTSPILTPAAENDDNASEISESASSLSSLSDLSDLNNLNDLEPVAVPDSESDEDDFHDASESSISQFNTSPSTAATSTSALVLPEPPAPPAFSPDNKVAYKQLLKGYQRDLKDYNRALKAYRKAECSRLKQERKLAKDVMKRSIEARKDAKKAKGSMTREEERGYEAAQQEDERKFERLERELEKKESEVERKVELQEQNVEACDRKIEKKLEKAERKREKDERKAVRKMEKAERKKEKELEKAQRKAEKQVAKVESKTKDREASPLTPLSPQASLDGATRGTTSSQKEEKPKKDRMFCVLPPKDASGNTDPCWARVFMEGVDEVGAHCGLFFPKQPWEKSEGSMQGEGGEDWSERYAKLVGAVCERLQEWAAVSAG